MFRIGQAGSPTRCGSHGIEQRNEITLFAMKMHTHSLHHIFKELIHGFIIVRLRVAQFMDHGFDFLMVEQNAPDHWSALFLKAAVFLEQSFFPAEVIIQPLKNIVDDGPSGIRFGS